MTAETIRERKGMMTKENVREAWKEERRRDHIIISLSLTKFIWGSVPMNFARFLLVSRKQRNSLTKFI